MLRNVLTLALASSAICFGAANATTISDPVGDFLPSFVGAQSGDLDVTSFSVGYNDATQIFSLSATLAGAIDPTGPEVYAIGVDTGTGPVAPFAAIGAPNVRFNQVIVVQKDGTASVGPNALTAAINGDTFTLDVPLADLPSTGFAPERYGFNLWPRNGVGANSQISDFAPNNSLVSAAVPEPGTWALMIIGVGLSGFALRRAKGRGRTALAV